MLRMPGGYCYELAHRDWRRAHNDSWAIEVYTPDGQERYVGTRYIDGSNCAVFRCPDGKFRAVMRHCVLCP